MGSQNVVSPIAPRADGVRERSYEEAAFHFLAGQGITLEVSANQTEQELDAIFRFAGALLHDDHPDHQVAIELFNQLPGAKEITTNEERTYAFGKFARDLANTRCSPEGEAAYRAFMEHIGGRASDLPAPAAVAQTPPTAQPLEPMAQEREARGRSAVAPQPKRSTAGLEEPRAVRRPAPVQKYEPAVAHLQDYLVQGGYYEANTPEQVDGIYGPRTQGAVAKMMHQELSPDMWADLADRIEGFPEEKPEDLEALEAFVASPAFSPARFVTALTQLGAEAQAQAIAESEAKERARIDALWAAADAPPADGATENGSPAAGAEANAAQTAQAETNSAAGGAEVAASGAATVTAFTPRASLFKQDGSGNWEVPEAEVAAGEPEVREERFPMHTGVAAGLTALAARRDVRDAAIKGTGAVLNGTGRAIKWTGAKMAESAANSRARTAEAAMRLVDGTRSAAHDAVRNAHQRALGLPASRTPATLAEIDAAFEAMDRYRGDPKNVAKYQRALKAYEALRPEAEARAAAAASPAKSATAPKSTPSTAPSGGPSTKAAPSSAKASVPAKVGRTVAARLRAAEALGLDARAYHAMNEAARQAELSRVTREALGKATTSEAKAAVDEAAKTIKGLSGGQLKGLSDAQAGAARATARSAARATRAAAATASTAAATTEAASTTAAAEASAATRSASTVARMGSRSAAAGARLLGATARGVANNAGLIGAAVTTGFAVYDTKQVYDADAARGDGNYEQTFREAGGQAATIATVGTWSALGALGTAALFAKVGGAGGSVVPGLGTAAGAVGGAILGLGISYAHTTEWGRDAAGAIYKWLD